MGATYTRQSSYSDGDTITAAHTNDEFNQLLAAFASSTGHTHNGDAGEGGPISLLSDSDANNKVLIDESNNHLEFYVEVSSSAVQQIRIQDGAIVPITDNDIDLGTSSLEFKDLHLDGTANIDSLVADTADINGGTVDNAIIGGSTAAAITGTTLVANTSLNIAGDGATVTGIKDEDDMSSNSATKLATQQSIKAYVDSQVTAQDLDFQADSGGALSIDLDSETMTFTGGTGIDTSGSGNAVTFAIDSTVATLAGTQTFTNKTLTSPKINEDVAVTATATEINLLDGVTATTNELNILDGVTSTAGELNLVDGSSAGTIVNSKAVVYGSSGEVNATTLQVGGTAITSTPAELNLLDGSAKSTSSITIADTDAFIIIDGTTTKQIPASDLSTYIGAGDITSVVAGDGLTGGATSGDATLNVVGGTGITANANDIEVDTSVVTTLTGSQTLTNKTFGSNTSFGDNNITNVGDIALDSISADGTDINVAVSDNSATAFTIKQGSDNYLVIDTGNGGESVQIGTGVSGTAITLGHGTSEVTVSDNLTVTGNLTVSGTTTTVNTTNTTISDNLLELNSGASSNSNDVGIIIQRGSTGNDALFMWDESADKFALGTTTDNASSTGNLNMTTGTLVANIEGNVTGNVTGNVSGTAATVTGAAQTNITSVGTLTALTVSGTAEFGSLSDGSITITAFVDEDNMASNSATLIPTQQSVKAYVDAQITAEDLDVTTDSGTIAIDLDSETMTIAGGSGIDTSATGNTVTIAGEDATTSNKGVASFSSDNFDVSSGAVSIKDGGIVTAELAADAVTGAKIADDAIDSEHYTDGSIDTVHISADAITGAKIADDAINSEHYTDGSIDTAHISADAITGAKIADNAIDSEHYTDGSIDTAHIGNLQVTTAKIAADAITGAKIADDAINSEHYTDGSIDTAHIADAQVTLAKIANQAANTVLVRDASTSGVVSAKAVADTQILIGDGTGFTAASLSGDVTMTNAGAVTIASSAVENSMLAGSIADSKLNTISTANKVSLSALDIDGGSDIGADLTTSDLIVVDDGAGGTNRKAALSRLTTFMSAQGFSTDDPTALAIALG